MCPLYVQTAPLSRERCHLLNVSKLGKISHGCIKAFRKKDCLRLDSITISYTQEAKCTSLKRSHLRLKTKHFFVQQRCLNSRHFTIPRRDGNENAKNSNRFSRQKKTLHVHLTFLYISFPFLRDYDVKLPNFTF